MAKSILHNKQDGTCYLCMLLNQDYARRTTHASRKLSERYGLKAYLCLQHHEVGPEAVHNNHENALLLQRKAQEAFERTRTREQWMAVFGKNYITEE